jgi:hypothetical protein
MSTASLTRYLTLTLPILASLARPVVAQEVTLSEQFKPGHTTKVEVQMKGTGKLALPPKEKGKEAQIVVISGSSNQVYEERLLTPDEPDTLKTIRIYREVAFERTLGDIKQDASIRPSVRRMVVMKPTVQKETLPRPVPFSPDGPLTLGELDVVRTDVFNPSLVPGLLPAGPVKPGQSWKASAAAVGELTNLDKVEDGTVTVEYVGVARPNGKQLARLKITGTVRGVNEDGPTRHKIDGTAYYDLSAGLLTYISVRGSKEMLDGKGQTVGLIEGQFTMTRTASAKMPAELADDSLRDLDLKPSPDNTLLLYDNPDLGVRLLHPRSWRLGAVQGRQLTLDHARGAGILITVEPVSKVPTPDDYLKEVLEDFKKNKTTATVTENPKRIRAEPVTLDCFALDATLGENKMRLRLEYTVLKQTDGGATVAASLPHDDKDLPAEVVRIVRSLSVTKKIEEKK